MKEISMLAKAREFNQPVLAAGLLLVAAGIFSVLIVDTTNWWNLTLVVLGVLTLGVFLAANLNVVRETGKKRSTLAQANLALVAAAMLGIVFGLNYVISRHPVRFDLTSNKFYTLSGQTTDILKKLTKDVNATLFTSAKRSSPEIQRAQQLLEEYAKINPKFRLKVVDVDKNPTEAKRLSVHEYNTVVFESGENRKDVLQRDYVTYALQGRQPTPKFQGEGAFTSALLTMSDTSHLTFYFTQGHGEKELNDPTPEGFNLLKDLVEKENYATKTLNILTSGKIPEDASVIAVIGPTKPFQSGEVELLRKYLSGGGKVVMCLDPLTRPGLDALLKDYGIRLGNDIVVDPTSYAFPDIRAVIPQYTYHAIVEKLSSDHVASIMAFSRSVQKTAPAIKGVNQVQFLQTTDKGWGVTNMKEKQPVYHPGVDTKGPVPLAMACEAAVPDTPAGSQPRKSRLVVIGGSAFMSNQFIQQVGNQDVALNSFGWVAEQENKISIHPKEEDARVLTLSNVTANLVTYLAVWIMPLAVLVAGGFIWYRRRSL